jgi:hypothetical protein
MSETYKLQDVMSRKRTGNLPTASQRSIEFYIQIFTSFLDYINEAAATAAIT